MSAVETPSKGKQILALIAFIAVPFAIGFAGSMLTSESIDGWYAVADKAPWTPPNWVFGPVWSVLYVLIGVSGWLVWKHQSTSSAETSIRSKALKLFVVQLVLNAIWTPIFFGAYPYLGVAALWIALVVIVALLAVVIAYMVQAKKLSALAAYLMVPYIVWGAYATTLNLYMALFN